MNTFLVHKNNYNREIELKFGYSELRYHISDLK